MIVNCINLIEREDRILSVSKQAKEQGFAIKFHEGIREKIIRHGVSLAHKKIVKQAKDNSDDYTIICEDDILFSAPNAFDYYIEKMPKDFDLYMGMIYNGQIVEGRIVEGFSGLTLYTVSKRFYSFFLEANPNEHLDRTLGSFADRFKYFVCDPFVCYQSGGRSDNTRQEMDYSVYHNEMKFYGR